MLYRDSKILDLGLSPRVSLLLRLQYKIRLSPLPGGLVWGRPTDRQWLLSHQDQVTRRSKSSGEPRTACQSIVQRPTVCVRVRAWGISSCRDAARSRRKGPLVNVKPAASARISGLNRLWFTLPDVLIIHRCLLKSPCTVANTGHGMCQPACPGHRVAEEGWQAAAFDLHTENPHHLNSTC